MTDRLGHSAYIDHAATAARAKLHPGEWLCAGSYENGNSAEKAARRIRTGETGSYARIGVFAATVRPADGFPEVWVRYLRAPGQPAKPLDMRPIEEVAAPRVALSGDAGRFQALVSSALARYASGEDVATERCTWHDPVRVAADIEAMAGLRRLRQFRKAGGAA
ncbi:hypothetical protein ACPCSP_20275 [Streptomyces cinereoruber]|uniref:hypothetical protein n=1 Tax=Streptomyces cinereoruber TaxID=67260 RepID=UPI003C2F8B2C